MQCSVLECYSEAVARSRVSNAVYCIECAIKVMKQHGPEVLVTISGAKFPWKYPVDGQCAHCGVNYNKYLIEMTGECPKCREDLPEHKGVVNEN